MRLLQFDLPVHAPYQLVRKNYENLAAPNLLVARPFRTGGVNGKAVAALQACRSTAMMRGNAGYTTAVASW